MQLEILASSISECLNDLGLLLDHLHKFSSQQREHYYQKIHSIKNKLLKIKANLKQCNINESQKQFKQTCLSLNTLKNQIMTHISLLNKENRDTFKVKEARENRKNYEDAMRLIIEREAEISSLRDQLEESTKSLLQKDSQITNLRSEAEKLKQDILQHSYANNQLKIEITILHSENRNKDDLLHQKSMEALAHQAFSARTTQELKFLTQELETVKLKLYHFEQLAEISMKKTKMVESNIRKVEEEAQHLNHHYRFKENESQKQQKMIEEYEEKLVLQGQKTEALSEENKRLKEDIAIIEAEFSKNEERLFQTKNSHAQIKKDSDQLIHALQAQLQTEKLKVNDFSHKIQTIQTKHKQITTNIHSRAEQSSLENQKLQEKLHEKDDHAEQLKIKLCSIELELQNRTNELSKSHDQLRRSLAMNQNLEVDVLKIKEKLRAIEKQNSLLQEQLQQQTHTNDELTIMIKKIKVDSEYLWNENSSLNQKWTDQENQMKWKGREVDDLKKRLIRAKIQAIHNIREVII